MQVINFDDEMMQFLKLLLYGQPGSTKTRTSCSAALDDRTYPTLLIDCRGNPLSIRDYERKPDVVSLDGFKDLNPVYSYLVGGATPGARELAEKFGHPGGMHSRGGYYKAVIVDSVTYLQRRAAAESIGASDLAIGDQPPPMEQRHHGAVLARMLNFADMMFKLPIHTILTAQEYEEMDANKNIYWRPMMTGQAAGEVPAYTYGVARMVHRSRLDPVMANKLKDYIDDQTDAVALWRPNPRWYAKWQYNKGRSIMVDPQVAEILDVAGIGRKEVAA